MTQTAIRLTLAIAVFLTTSLHAQPAGGPPKPFEARFVGVHQFDTDLDNGGSFSTSRFAANFDWTKVKGRESAYGLTLGYEFDTYDFSGSAGVFGANPWDDITTLTLGGTYYRALDNDWRIFFNPSISSSSESGIDSNALLYSLVAGASTEVSEGLNLGFGAVAVAGLEEFRVFPFLSVKWEINENWTLQNPLRPGPTGPAGLEIEYAGDGWSASTGFAYRSWRFRIDGQGPTVNGIAEYSGTPLFARYTRELSETLTLDLYGGVLVAGELEIEDKNGKNLRLQDDIDTAPFVAFAISGKF